MSVARAVRAGLVTTSLTLLAGCPSSTGADPEAAEPTSTMALGSRPGDGIIVHAIAPESRWTEVVSLPAAGTEPFPRWAAFDQDTGRFLFANEESASIANDAYVLSPGLDAPVARVECWAGCGWQFTFGPGEDEFTSLVGMHGTQSRTAQIWGFDDELHDQVDLTAVVGQGRGISDLEWSPDGSQLAVSTFEGLLEPTCHDVPNDALVYLFARDGGDPVLIHRRAAQPGAAGEPPVLHDLAWSPDGERLGLVSSTYCRNGLPRTATLVALDVASGKAEALHQFDGNHDYASATLGFAWSPDGTRIAITSGAGIVELSSDGEHITQTGDSGPGPLAWLAPPNG